MENPLTSILERFSLIARPEILRDHLPSSCIASTWITIQVMHQLGFSARPLEVRLSVGNAAYRRLRDQLGPPRTQAQLAEWSREHGACVVGVGFDDGSVAIGGHLVAVVDGRFLVDASIDQATDASHGLTPPPVLYGPIDPLFLSGQIRLQRLDVLELFIEYSRHPTTRPYTTSYDWGHNPETNSAVSRILSEIKGNV
jgi:hypothetical protein